MTRYVVDFWAWIEYLEGSPLDEKARERLADDGNEIFTRVVSLAETISKVRRSERDTDAWSAPDVPGLPRMSCVEGVDASCQVPRSLIESLTRHRHVVENTV